MTDTVRDIERCMERLSRRYFRVVTVTNRVELRAWFEERMTYLQEEHRLAHGEPRRYTPLDSLAEYLIKLPRR